MNCISATLLTGPCRCHAKSLPDFRIGVADCAASSSTRAAVPRPREPRRRALPGPGIAHLFLCVFCVSLFVLFFCSVCVLSFSFVFAFVIAAEDSCASISSTRGLLCRADHDEDSCASLLMWPLVPDADRSLKRTLAPRYHQRAASCAVQIMTRTLAPRC